MGGGRYSRRPSALLVSVVVSGSSNQPVPTVASNQRIPATTTIQLVVAVTAEDGVVSGSSAHLDPSDTRLAAAREEQWDKGSFRGRLRVLRGILGEGSSSGRMKPFEAQVTVAGYRDGIGEERYLRKDGSYTWVSVSATFMRQAKDRPDCFVLIIEDIDARKRMELELGSLTTREKEVLLLLARGARPARRPQKTSSSAPARSGSTHRTSSRS